MPSNEQCIDFMTVLPTRYRPAPTARHIGMSWLLAGIGLLLVHAYMLTTVQHVQNQHASQLQQLRHIVHVHSRPKGQGDLARGRIIAIAPESLHSDGFSHTLRHLTSASAPSVWLADAWIDNTSRRIQLSGRASHPALTPSLLAALRTQPSRMHNTRLAQYVTPLPSQGYQFMITQGATAVHGGWQ